MAANRLLDQGCSHGTGGGHGRHVQDGAAWQRRARGLKLDHGKENQQAGAGLGFSERYLVPGRETEERTVQNPGGGRMASRTPGLKGQHGGCGGQGQTGY